MTAAVVLRVDLSLCGTGLVALPVDWALDWSRVAFETIGHPLRRDASEVDRIGRLVRLSAEVVRFAEERAQVAPHAAGCTKGDDGWTCASGCRLNELLHGNAYRKPVDFHSWRRAYNQALADANVNAQQAQALAGHSTLEAHQRYLQNTAKMRAIPLAALPKVLVTARTLPAATFANGDAKTPEVRDNENGESSLKQANGVYLNLVEGRLWVPAVAGSNPATPTVYPAPP